MLPEAAAYKSKWQKAQRARLMDDECDKDSFVYVHIRESDNQPFYVGIGSRITRPWDYKHHSRTDWHKNVSSKHGVRTEIVIDSITLETAKFWEICWIKAFREAGYGLVNITPGGDGRRGLPAHNRRNVLCLETGELFVSATHAAKKFNISNIAVSDVCNLKYRSVNDIHFIYSDFELDEFNRFKKIKEIENICANRRKKVEVNKCYDGVKDGRDNKGRKATGPMKISRKVLCLDDGEIYPSASEAARIYNVAKSAIIELCLGKNNRKTVGGLKFKYVEET
jgi:hypothetical protein